ncbi:ABC transporter permease [Xylocopilactobacillus apis]|uniref:ABC transporter permease n=1 Tax=Xylocopilactobacillus apis TaxID=2932183 RepID=A0AAU9D2L1_9LACO|nr:ABC transporter permease subunit [Xylocopilactobacillus apis]BDR55630.1 hypothetical protein KIMC2_01920 [Xylocopilactobacillus apis]
MKLLINEWRKFFRRKGISIPFPTLQLITTLAFFAIIRFSSKSHDWDINSFFETSMQISISFLILLGILFASTTITREMSSGTIKFLLTRPYDRHKILMAKFASIAILMSAFTLVSIILNYIFVLIFFGQAPGMDVVFNKGGIAILTVLFETVFFSSFALMISTVINSSSMATAISIVYYYVIPGIWTVIAMLLKIKIDSWGFRLSPFYSYKYLTDLTKFNSDFAITLAANLVYICIFYLIADTFFNKKDISLSN